MDRCSNSDDIFGLSPFTDTYMYGSHSTALHANMAPGEDEAHEDGPQERTARIQDTNSTTGRENSCGGCGPDPSISTQTKRAVTDQPIALEDLGQRDSPLSHPTSEREETTDHQQPGYRPLQQGDSEGLARPPVAVPSSRQRADTFWLPFWARRTTSLLFMATFALMIAVLEVLLTISQQYSGLSQGVTSIRYSWSYGTTGILTFTAALWHRLDYETKVSAPWLRAYPITSTKAALLVDYVDTWSLLTPFRALRNKDYEVFCSSTVSLLLQALIVLSTALYTLTPTNLVNEAEPVFLTSRFVDDPSRLKDHSPGSLLPFYITMGTQFALGHLHAMAREDAIHPEGCTGQFAYQTFYPASSSLEEVTTTVDGLALRLECDTLSVGERVSTPHFVAHKRPDSTSWQSNDSPHIEVEYQGCQAAVGWDMVTSDFEDNFLVENHTFRDHAMVLSRVEGFASNQCNSIKEADPRLVFLSAEVEWRSNIQRLYDNGTYKGFGVDIDAAVSQAAALICTPSLEQTLLDVSRSSGGVKSVARHNGKPPNFLRAVQPWDFIDFFFGKGAPGVTARLREKVMVGDTAVHADDASQVVLAFCGESCFRASGLLNDTALLQDILGTFLADYAATTAHVMLTEQVNITSTGTSSRIVVRLRVQPLVCHAMVALLALITLTIMGFQFKHKKKLTRRMNPGSIAGSSILVGQDASSNFPTGLGAASIKDLHEALDGFFADHEASSPHHLQCPRTVEEESLSRSIADAGPGSFGRAIFQKPLPLRPLSHIALVWTIAACGTTLMVLLRKSTDELGLGDATASEYLLLAWTTVPATILTAISWWLSSIDTQVRLLAPYHLLRSNRCNCSVLRMDLLRGLVPFVLYQELKTSNFAAASTTLAALLAAFLTTVSAAMFHAVPLPISRPAELSSNTVFTKYRSPLGTDLADTSSLASLILETNLSYPRGSYQNLVFPDFSMTPLGVKSASDGTNASSAKIKVTAPALRPGLTCREYPPVDIAAVYVRNESVGYVHVGKEWNGIVVNITLENCKSDGDPQGIFETAFFETGNLSEATFATTTWTGEAGIYLRWKTCSDVLYIWGHHDTSLGLVTNISAVGCNNSEELVDVTFALLESDLQLDLSDAPAIIESTARGLGRPGFLDWGPGSSYPNLASLPTTNHTVFDFFFQQLVTSRYAIPISAIGDPTQADIVMDAIRLQHGIIAAQDLNSNYRVDKNSGHAKADPSAVLVPTLFNQSVADGAMSYSATVTYPFGTHRVVQDPTATAVLEALLLSILILVMLGWYLGPSKPALPRSPSSVGSVLALLAGGNVLERLYDGGSEPLCWDDVKSRLGKDSKLYLGWNTVNDGEGDEQRRFGIWVTD